MTLPIERDTAVSRRATLAKARTGQGRYTDLVLGFPIEFGLGYGLSGPEHHYGPNPAAFGHDGFGQVRLQRKCLPIAAQALVHFVLRLENIAQIQVNLGQTGFQRQRLLIARRSLLELVFGLQDIAEIGMIRGACRVNRDGFAYQLGSVVRPPGLKCDHAQ